MGRYYSWSRVRQGSILGPLLFKIYLCDIFYEYENNYFTYYADDTAPFIVGNNTTEILANLSSLARNMKAIHDKCNLLLSTKESPNIQIPGFTIKSSKAKKWLSVKAGMGNQGME